jgi:hypothetical protein
LAKRGGRLTVSAEGEGKGDGKDGSPSATQEKLVQDLKKGGVDKETAQRILKVWEETGAKSPDGLRKLLVGRSLKAAGLVGFQTLLDAGASWGALSSAAGIGAGGDFFGKIVVEYLCYFLGLYFGTSVILDLFTLGAIGFSGYQYSTNSKAFLGAIKQVAGPSSGLNVVEKTKAAVNTAKVIGALNKISAILKEKDGGDVSFNSLQNLSVYLTLQKAEEAGFKAEDYGITGEEAAKIAAVFAKYDENDDFVLSTYEMNQLFRKEGYNLSEAEVTEAIKLLDKNGDKLIQFSEFVDWWKNEVPEAKKSELERSTSSK